MKSKEPLISIIVPIFNVEEYLDRSISSIIKQTYKNFELILVNDGSTDNSRLICEGYAKKDSRIKLINKINGGVASARNVGLENANGQYIGFVDPDDFVDEDYIEFLYYSLVNNKCDISICGYYHYYMDGLKKIKHYENIDEVLDNIKGMIYLNTVGYYGNGLWNKLFKLELFNDIKFPEGKLSEDWFVLFKLISKANKIYYNSKPKYYYQQRKGSITRNSKINYDCVEASKECLVFCENNYPQVVPSAIQAYVLACIGVYNTILCSTSNYKQLKLYKNRVDVYKNKVSLNGIDKFRRIQIKLFYHSTLLYNLSFKVYNLFRKVKYSI